MEKLLFGTAGIPSSTHPHNTIEGIKKVKSLNLSCMELEFVHSINIEESKTKEVKETAKKENIILSCHAQYAINLNSKNKTIVEASKQRILKAAKIANLCGAFSLCFHAAYYQDISKEQTYQNVKEQLKEIIKRLDSKIQLRPEVAGKVSQFADYKTIIKLSSELEQIHPCIDFAHQHARTNGEYNNKQKFSKILEEIEKVLGKNSLKNMHIHISGINYSEKGEKHHLTLKESNLKYKELLETFKNFNIKGIVISESPNIEKDALLLKNTFENEI